MKSELAGHSLTAGSFLVKNSAEASDENMSDANSSAKAERPS
jgi:hypothetical protein